MENLKAHGLLAWPVSGEWTPLARHLYESCGFAVHERLPSYYGQDQVGLRLRKKVVR